MQKYRLSLLLLLAFGTLLAPAAEASVYSGTYLHFGSAAAYSHVRDAGTSPLRYQGGGGDMLFAFVSQGDSCHWGIRTEGSFSAGFAAESHMLFCGKMRTDLHYLRKIPALSRGPREFLAGGSILSNMSVSLNDAYQNAAVNADIFCGLHLSTKIIQRFSRPASRKKIPFATIYLPERYYALSWRLDLPLLTANRRPPFAYVINGTQTEIDIFDGHFFAGGFHLRSDLGITRYLENGNAFRLAYIWDMYTSGRRDLYRLETASHALECSFYFRMD